MKAKKKGFAGRLAAIIAAALLALALLTVIFWDPIFRSLVHPVYTAVKLRAFQKEQKTAPPGGIVFLGDSTIDSWSLAEYFPEYTVYNRGVMGDATNHVLDRLPDALALEPALVILLVGTNDFLNEGRSVQEAVDGYAQILNSLQASSPGTQVICLSVFPGYDHMLYKIEQWQGQLVEFNSRLKALAPQYGYLYTDVYALLADPASGLASAEYFKDGVHPSEAGYTLVANVLKPLIKELGIPEEHP